MNNVFKKVCWDGFIFEKRPKIYSTYIIPPFFNTEPWSPPTPSLLRTNTLIPISSRLFFSLIFGHLGSGGGEGKHHNIQVTENIAKHKLDKRHTQLEFPNKNTNRMCFFVPSRYVSPVFFSPSEQNRGV